MSVPLLPNANGVIIQDTNFTNARTINNYNSYGAATSEGLTPSQIFERNIAYDALFNADARFDPPKCHPQTRTAVLDHIDRHISDLENPVPIIWLRGAAGAGKSAIAQTLAERWNDRDTLAASFFLSRSAAGRNDKKSLIPTLAYQLMVSVPSTRVHIEDVLKHDIGILKKNLKTQMMKLIIRPLAIVASHTSTLPTTIIIDGLDECCIDHEHQDHEEQQREILEAITFAVQQSDVPLRFLLGSRPEREIRECFAAGKLKTLTSVISLDSSQNPSADIELYLQCKFDEIRRKHPSLGPSWPPTGTIAQLVQKSSGQFIYAAVVIRFLSSPRTDPEASLRTIMGFEHNKCGESPFADLDALYICILESVALRSVPAVTSIFEVMIYGLSVFDLFPSGQRRNSPAWLAEYFFLSLNQVYQHLVDLHSVVEIPAEDHSFTPISFIHASFSEFLTNPSRSSRFFIDKSQAQLKLQLIRLRHIFAQVLCAGKCAAGGINGFALEMKDQLEQPHPLVSAEIREGLEALYADDMDQFMSYAKAINLDHLGTARDEGIRDYLPRSVVSAYIERCKTEGVGSPRAKLPQPHDRNDDREPSDAQPQKSSEGFQPQKQRGTVRKQIRRWWQRVL